MKLCQVLCNCFSGGAPGPRYALKCHKNEMMHNELRLNIVLKKRSTVNLIFIK